MNIAPGYAVHDPAVVPGHPEVPLLNEQGNLIQMLTVCCECGSVHSIIMLVRDRWYCSTCRAEGRVDRNVTMIPIS